MAEQYIATKKSAFYPTKDAAARKRWESYRHAKVKNVQQAKKIPKRSPATVKHIDQLRGLVEPQWKWRFEIELPALVGFTSDQLRSIEHRIVSVSPVFEFTMTAKEGPWKNSHWYYMEDDDCTPYTLTFYEYKDLLTQKYFKAWKALEINDDGTYNPPIFYKKLVKIKFLGPGKGRAEPDEDVVGDIILGGCFPDKFSVPDVDYSTHEPVNVEVSITYDGEGAKSGPRELFPVKT